MAGAAAWPGRVPARGVDVAVAVVSGVVGLLVVRPGGDDFAGATGALASLLGLAGGLVLLLRRTRPVGVLAASTAAWAVQAALVGAVVPLSVWVALHACARWAPPRHALAAAFGGLAAVAAVLLVVDAGDVSVSFLLVALLAVLLGALGSSAEQRRAGQLREAAAGERLRIARDLHDVGGHGLGAIAVQAGAGRMALDAGSLGEARESLAAIETTSRAALRETRWLLGMLRDDAGHDLRDVPALVAAADRAGLRTTLSVTGDPARVSPDVSAAGYRVVQESLTNALRHSGATTVEVTVDAGTPLRLTVRDDGQGLRGEPTSDGHGLAGMRERVEALGGELVAGPRADGRGWAVEATWPRPGARP